MIFGALVLSCGNSAPSADTADASGSSGTTDAAAIPDQATSTAVDAGLGSDGGASGFAPDYVSGSRLRARYWIADDGTRQFDGWFDQKLMTPCAFTMLADGSSLCLPRSTIAVSSSNSFADMGCKQRFAQGAAEACLSSKYALDGTDVYEVGPAMNLTTTYDSSIGCMPVPQASTEISFALGRKLAASELVAGHVEQVGSGHRLKAITIVADDGTRQRTGWYDVTLSNECTVALAVDGTAHCLPITHAFGNSLFADANCMMPAASTFTTPGQQEVVPKYARLQVDKCSNRERVFTIAGPATGDIYSTISGMCMKATIPASEKAYLLGTELMPAAMDGFTDTPIGSGRLKVAARADAEGAIDRNPGTITDTMLQTACTFSQTSDGKAHCVPPFNEELFLEMGCTQGISVGAMQDCGLPQNAFAGVWSGDGCTGGLELSSVGPTTTAPAMLFNKWSKDTCLPIAGGGGNTIYSSLGAAVPPSSLVGAMLVVE